MLRIFNKCASPSHLESISVCGTCCGPKLAPSRLKAGPKSAQRGPKLDSKWSQSLQEDRSGAGGFEKRSKPQLGRFRKSYHGDFGAQRGSKRDPKIGHKVTSGRNRKRCSGCSEKPPQATWRVPKEPNCSSNFGGQFLQGPKQAPRASRELRGGWLPLWGGPEPE